MIDGPVQFFLGPLGDSMSAAARPKCWGVSRQAKGREFNPTKVECPAYFPPCLTGCAIQGTWGNLGGKRKNK
jgi:hypothetical protein